jgi:hypothetical protein
MTIEELMRELQNCANEYGAETEVMVDTTQGKEPNKPIDIAFGYRVDDLKGFVIAVGFPEALDELDEEIEEN